MTKADEIAAQGLGVLLVVVCLLRGIYLYRVHGSCSQKVNKHKKDFDECIVKMKVLPHDEAHILQKNNNEPRTHKVRNFPTLIVLKRCCTCKGKHAISPLAEAKLNDPVEEVGQRTPKKQGDARTDSNTCDELALAEEGEGMNNDDTHACAICMEQYRVGEWVALSALGHCQVHAYHYDCLLKWVALGKEECPMCKETFWSAAKGSMEGEDIGLESGGEREGVDLEVLSHRQFCETHGLTIYQA